MTDAHDSESAVELPQDALLEMFRRMERIRRFEEAATSLVATGELYGAFHTSIGQEASIVGACAPLRVDDYMVGTHRSHGHPIGKGARLDRLMAELAGRKTGVNGGKGGSMHLADFSVGSLGETSIVGSGLPVAVGAALASSLRGDDRVTLCFFGDGASNEGAFHEAMNLAAVWQLPVVFVCENNLYGELTAASKVLPLPDVAVRAAAYDIPAEIVDGQDVLAVQAAVSRAVERARSGGGPGFVETKTYRFDNHSIGLWIDHYRDAAEVELWRTERDPLTLYAAALAVAGVDDDVLDAVRREVALDVAEAVEFARTSPLPDPSDAFEYLYTDPIHIDR